MAHDRASMDGRDEVEESQHGTLFEASLGLERLSVLHVCNLSRTVEKKVDCWKCINGLIDSTGRHGLYS